MCRGVNLMLNSILNLILGKPGAGQSPKSLEITASIQRLQTLTCRDGRVSIDPSEILTPQYLAARRRAAELLLSHNSN
jgi:hypothetical protein